MKRFNYLFLAAAAMLFAACSHDDQADGYRLPEGKFPLVIEATGLQISAFSDATRATVDGNWEGVTAVALQVGTEVKEYTVTTDATDSYTTATLSSTDPFFWTSRADLTVSAWYPYNAADLSMPNVVVQADQSTTANFAASDFIVAEAQAVKFDNPTLSFSHRTARVKVDLRAGAGITSVTGATVSLVNLDTQNGNPVTVNTCTTGENVYEALVAPQTIAAGTSFIQVDLGGTTYYFQPKSTVALQAGKRYTYVVSVTGNGLELALSAILGWEDIEGETGDAEDLGYAYDAGTHTYNVYNIEGLLAWNELVQDDLTLNCTLTADIDLTGQTWTTVGDATNGYTGTFNGQGHTITGAQTVLFERIGSKGKVMNLQLKDISVVSTENAAGLVLKNYGTIAACSVMGTIEGGTAKGNGGIVYNQYGTLIACYFSGTVSNGLYVGGIAANSSGDLISACYWAGTVSGNKGIGVDAVSQGGTTKVDGTTVTWEQAITSMNAALETAGYTEWRYKLGEDGLPVLTDLA